MDLYITDLDGTLLNSKQCISAWSTAVINRLIGENVNFTVATARSMHSAGAILSSLDLRLPLVLMNGVFIYDPIEKRNLVSNYLDENTAFSIIGFYEERGISPFVYTEDEKGRNHIYYKGIFNENQRNYHANRMRQGDKRFVQVEDFCCCAGQKFITINALDRKEVLDPLYKELKDKVKGHFHYTEDIYTRSHFWLEITHPKANKKDGVLFVKRYLNAKRLICFGDNLNDLPMFDIADCKFAVSNSHELVKRRATQVIGSNDEDGVAEFLQHLLVKGRISEKEEEKKWK